MNSQQSHEKGLVLNKEDLPFNGQSREFEGFLFGGVKASFIMVDAVPGEGARLHSHPYEEIFFVLEGQATYVVGTETIEVKAGQIVIAPANAPHKFTNTGEGRLKQIDVHLSTQFITTWLEEASA
jgi:mannose-6-phosphate isomerase-like protein (cupin superfamily)